MPADNPFAGSYLYSYGHRNVQGLAWAAAIYIANLRGERLRKVPLGAPAEFYVNQYGRLRDVVGAPDGRLYVLTNNTDGRGTPQAGNDRLLSVPVL